MKSIIWNIILEASEPVSDKALKKIFNAASEISKNEEPIITGGLVSRVNKEAITFERKDLHNKWIESGNINTPTNVIKFLRSLKFTSDQVNQIFSAAGYKTGGKGAELSPEQEQALTKMANVMSDEQLLSIYKQVKAL